MYAAAVAALADPDRSRLLLVAPLPVPLSPKLTAPIGNSPRSG